MEIGTDSMLNPLAEALDDLRRGRPVIVVDDETRENEGDLILPADLVSADWINFMATHARGLICVAVTGEVLDRIGIPMMASGGSNGSKYASPFTVSVEAAQGVTTGISAADRAETIRRLIHPDTTADDIKSPGHVFPLRAHPDGLAARRGHTEAAVTLSRMIGSTPAGVICEIMNSDGTMARMPQLAAYARRHAFKLISIDQIVEALETGETAPELISNPATQGVAGNEHHPKAESPRTAVVTKDAEATLPTHFGSFRVAAYRDAAGLEHLCIHHGELTQDPPLIRIHSECLTGDVLGSVRCDCGEQLNAALKRIADEKAGVLIYLRQEGRGIGLANKIRAYALQDDGMDTVEANMCLGFRADERSYSVAAAILHDLDIKELRLLTNNPAKITGLTDHGIQVVERIPIEIEARPENKHYLSTKRKRLAHLLELSTSLQPRM